MKVKEEEEEEEEGEEGEEGIRLTKVRERVEEASERERERERERAERGATVVGEGATYRQAAAAFAEPITLFRIILLT